MTKQDSSEVHGVALCANADGAQVLANRSSGVWAIQSAGRLDYISQSYVSEGIRQVAVAANLPFYPLAPGDVIALPRDHVTRWTLERNLSYVWSGSAQAFDSLTAAAEAKLVRWALKNSPRSEAAIYTCVDQTFKSIGSSGAILSSAEALERVRAGLNTAAQAGKCATSVKAALDESGPVKVPKFVDIAAKVGTKAEKVIALESKFGKLNIYMRYVCQATPKFC